MSKNSLKWIKYLLRADYIVYFIIGIVCLSLGIGCFFYNDTTTSNLKDFNLFIGSTTIFIGIAIIIVAFYRKRQYEDIINKKKL